MEMTTILHATFFPIRMMRLWVDRLRGRAVGHQRSTKYGETDKAAMRLLQAIAKERYRDVDLEAVIVA